jgi:hypothetical protein
LDLPAGRFGQERFQLLCQPGQDLVRRTGAVEFLIKPEEITARLLDPQREFLVDIGLFGLAIPLWLERRGWPVLHASAVAMGGGAVGFVASASGGKSSLAAALMESGAELLTDDALALEPRAEGRWLAHASFPQLRLWPADARRLLGSVEGLLRSHPSHEKLRVPVMAEGVGHSAGWGRFATRAVPLSVLYLPEQVAADDPVSVAPIRGGQALIDLVRQSAVPALAQAAGLGSARFERLTHLAGELASRQALRTLRVPASLERLTEVAAFVRSDLEFGLEVAT